MVRCCHVKVLIAGLQCRDCWPRKRASRNLRHFTLVCGKSAKRGSHIGWSKSSARHTVPCATHLPADQQKAFGWHLPLFFFLTLLLASSKLVPSSILLAVYGSTATCRVLYWAPRSAVTSKDCTEPSLQSSSLLTLTVQRSFPQKPRMEMAEGESGRL